VRTKETYRGIPRATILDYLEELGGVDRGDFIEGPDWRVRMEASQDRIGSLDIPVLTLHIEGLKGSVQSLLQRLKVKTMRAGG